MALGKGAKGKKKTKPMGKLGLTHGLLKKKNHKHEMFPQAIHRSQAFRRNWARSKMAAINRVGVDSLHMNVITIKDL